MVLDRVVAIAVVGGDVGADDETSMERAVAGPRAARDSNVGAIGGTQGCLCSGSHDTELGSSVDRF
jgi:hypothetical protein